MRGLCFRSRFRCIDAEITSGELMFSRATALSEIAAVLRSEKNFSPWPDGWIFNKSGHNNRFSFVATFAITGIDVAGFRLVGHAPGDQFEEDVIFQFQALLSGRWRPVERFEYRPLGGHRNPRNRRDLASYIEDGTSHVHRFQDNASLGLSAIERDNLPLARTLEPPPSSLNEFRRIVAGASGVPDLVHIEWPEWQGRLL